MKVICPGTSPYVLPFSTIRPYISITSISDSPLLFSFPSIEILCSYTPSCSLISSSNKLFCPIRQLKSPPIQISVPSWTEMLSNMSLSISIAISMLYDGGM
uniref:Uncharacterized protein n=1 Tax=Cacopsylla melanoneura TaxID=428564 RepID=A0A8D8XVF4_9HEMI